MSTDRIAGETRCKSCDRRVLFVKDGAGTTQILDLVAPVYELTALPQAIRTAHSYVSHFATCPAASTHSRKGTR